MVCYRTRTPQKTRPGFYLQLSYFPAKFDEKTHFGAKEPKNGHFGEKKGQFWSRKPRMTKTALGLTGKLKFFYPRLLVYLVGVCYFLLRIVQIWHFSPNMVQNGRKRQFLDKNWHTSPPPHTRIEKRKRKKNNVLIIKSCETGKSIRLGTVPQTLNLKHNTDAGQIKKSKELIAIPSCISSTLIFEPPVTWPDQQAYDV